MRYIVTGGSGFVGLHLVEALLKKDITLNYTCYPFDYSQIQKDLNWQITKDIEDILPDIIEWYRDSIKMFESLL